MTTEAMPAPETPEGVPSGPELLDALRRMPGYAQAVEAQLGRIKDAEPVTPDTVAQLTAERGVLYGLADALDLVLEEMSHGIEANGGEITKTA